MTGPGLGEGNRLHARAENEKLYANIKHTLRLNGMFETEHTWDEGESQVGIGLCKAGLGKRAHISSQPEVAYGSHNP